MIYVSSACVKKSNIAEVIKLLVKNGITSIELSGGTCYYEEIEHDLIMLKQVYQLKYACHAYFPPPKDPFVVNLASCNDQIYKRSIDHYTNCIEMLKRIGCPVLSVHAGFLVEIGTDEIGNKLSNRVVYNDKKAYDRFCSAYMFISELCRKNDIALFLENNVLSAENYKEFDYHNYMMMTDYESIMKMKKQLDFNLLLDLGHLHVSSNTLKLNYSEQCNKLRDHVRWIHISDNDGVFDGHKPLRRKSKIVQEFRKIWSDDIDVTLETVGNVHEILSSIEMLKEKYVLKKEEL